MTSGNAALLEKPMGRIPVDACQPEVSGVSNYVFSDLLLTATELNRKPGRVLDMAREQPITITRNDESFALMSRSLARKMTARWRDAVVVSDLFQAVLQLRDNALAPDSPYSWIRTLDREEQSDFLREVFSVIQDADSEAESDQAATSVAAVIHEWRESAMAMNDREHGTAFAALQEGKPVQLTVPGGLGSKNDSRR